MKIKVEQDISNLLAETLNKLSESGKSASDVRFVLGNDARRICYGEETQMGTWGDFAACADFNYDAGHGVVEISMSLKIVGDDWWLERGEYDGAEWWEFKTRPLRPVDAKPLTSVTSTAWAGIVGGAKW
jgi:hypothetical protein